MLHAVSIYGVASTVVIWLCGELDAHRPVIVGVRQNSVHVYWSFLTAAAIANLLVASVIAEALMTGLIG